MNLILLYPCVFTRDNNDKCFPRMKTFNESALGDLAMLIEKMKYINFLTIYTEADFHHHKHFLFLCSQSTHKKAIMNAFHKSAISG